MRMQMIRKGGAVLLVVAAAVVMATQGPSVKDPDAVRRDLIDALGTDATTDVAEIASQALSDYELNDARTESAPQQQVTNGWVARDLLAAIAFGHQSQINLGVDTQALIAQVAAEPEALDERPAWLLFLVVCGLALFAATTQPAAAVLGSSAPTPSVQNGPEDPSPLD